MLLRSIVGVAVLLMFSGFVLINSNLVDYTYYLEDSSKLYIEGTSNVNSFDCSCKDNFPKRSIKVAFSDDLKTIRFTNSYFKIRTQSLDCNNSRMNKDLCEALKSSEYPDIKIELKDAKLQSTTPGSDGWLSIKVNASMTITNVTKDIVLDVKGKKTSDEKFRFRPGFNAALSRVARSVENDMRTPRTGDHWLALLLNISFHAGISAAAQLAENSKSYFSALPEIETEIEPWSRYPQIVDLFERQLSREARRSTGAVAAEDWDS